MGVELFIIVFAVTVILVVDLKRRDQLPMGCIWIASSMIYGGLGIVLGLRALGHQPSTNLIDWAADQLALSVFALALIAFAGGYCLMKITLPATHACEIRIALLIRQASSFSYYSLLAQLLIAGYILISILFDLPDRYNTYPGSTMIGKIISSLSLTTLLGPAAFFCLGWQARKSTSWPKSSMAKLTCSAAVFNLMLVLKTGSRSILLGLLVSFLIGWLAHSASRRIYVQVVGAVLLLLLIFIPFSEALRIARSDSDFYRANPVHAVALLQASLRRQPEPNVILKQLDRHPLDHSIYKIVAECQDSLLRTGRVAAKDSRAVQLSRRNGDDCDVGRPGHIATKYWPSLTRILAGFSRADFSLLFPSQPYLHSLEINLYGITNLSSKGEAPSLRADVYYRFGFVGVLLVYLCLGFLYGAFNCACFYLLRHTNVYSQLSVGLLPLTLMTGNLSLTLLTQIWLLAVQLPKNICIVFVVGSMINVFAKRFNPAVGPCQS